MVIELSGVQFQIELVLRARSVLNHRHDLDMHTRMAGGQLRINFTRIFEVVTKLPESRSGEDNLQNFENTTEI